MGYLVVAIAILMAYVTILVLWELRHLMFTKNETVEAYETLYSPRIYFHRLQLGAFNVASTGFYVAIIIGTMVLIIVFKLKMKSRTVLMGKKKDMHSAQETRLVRSVIAVCVFYIVTACPRSLLEATSLSPGILLSLSVRLRDFYIILYGISQCFDAVNHSFNIFVFAAVNLRFRSSLVWMFNSVVRRVCLDSK